MASITTTLLLLATLLLSTLPPSHPLPFSNFHSLLSLSHSLTTRVANLREARGDHAGAARARHLSNTIQQGLGFNFFKLIFTLGYDFIRNYAFSSPFRTTELTELVSSLTEFSRIESVEQRVAWIARNRGKLIRVSRGLLDRLVESFGRSGPLKDVLEAVKKEVVDGDLLTDCLHLGSGDDLVGVVKILKDIVTQYYPSKKTDL